MSLNSLKARLVQSVAPPLEIVSPPQDTRGLGFTPKSLLAEIHPDDMRPLDALDKEVVAVINGSIPIGVKEAIRIEPQLTENIKAYIDPEPAIRFHQAEGTHTPVAVLLGPGGTGKTYRIRQYQEQNESERVALTATTGVAAINIGPTACTINSMMRFFNEDSLKDNLSKAGVVQRIKAELADLTLIVIDEVSMLSSGILEMIFEFIESINRQRAIIRSAPLKILLSGDFCQLPPVVSSTVGAPIPFAFHAKQWDKVFEPAITKLTRNYRQSGDQSFQEALQRCRIGDAAGAVASLRCNYLKSINYDFQGLTLYAVNKEVETHNTKKLRELPSDPIIDCPSRWGEQHKDWKEIPDPICLKVGAQIRVTANLKNQSGGEAAFQYVNGDIGVLLAYSPSVHAHVKLNRGTTVYVVPVTRMNLKPLNQNENPPTYCNGVEVPVKWTGEDRYKYEAYIESQTMKGRLWFHPKEHKWVIGEIKFVPVMLGWASSYHRAQGLTVPTLQIDIKPAFSGSAQMMYVALSRCTSASGIFITRGDAAKLATRISVHREVAKYV